MRIAIIATGSRGDVQPYIALGRGLHGAGHAVRLVTHENFQALVNSHGLEFWPLPGDVAAVAQSEQMRARLAGGNILSIMSQMAKEAERGALGLAEGGLAASQGMDLLVAGMGGVYVAIALAEKLQIPVVEAYLVPFSPTGAFPGVLLPGQLPSLGGPINRATHHLTRQIMWQSFRSADRRARQEVLGLPPAPFWGPYDSPWTRSYPMLYGFSPSVIPPPADWGEFVQVTGYWFLDSADEWTPPAALLEFLDAGPKPVYVGFGSMGSRDPEETTDLIVRALALAGQRAVLLSGWSGLRKKNLPDSVCMIDSIPHAWLFPLMAAVVHHGGAGTTGAGLRAGVPNIVISFFGDQPFWGRRIADLGVGPTPISRRQLTAERLAQVIRQAVTDQGMQWRAADLGRRIQAEDGIANAVATIGGIVA